MSPSGSRMQTAGTSMFSNPFCRRASRNSAAGRNTDGADGFLFSSNGGIFNSTGASKDCTVVVRRDLDTIAELQAAQRNGSDGLFGRHAQLRRWATWLSKHDCFLTRPCVPAHDSKQTAGLQSIVDSPAETRLVGDAMECSRQEHRINRLLHHPCDVVGVSLDKCAVRCPNALGTPQLRGFQQHGINVDGDHAASDLAQWQREPTIAGAQVNYFHAGDHADIPQYFGRIGP